MASDIWVMMGSDEGVPELCPDIVAMMAPNVFGVLEEYVITKNRICDELLGFCARPYYTELTVEDFTTRVMADKPAIIADDEYINNLYREVRADPNERKTIKAVHMSDPHIDFWYKEGTLAKCDSYECCRETWGYPEDPSLAAGPWGGYECDLPVQTLQSMLDHLRD